MIVIRSVLLEHIVLEAISRSHAFRERDITKLPLDFILVAYHLVRRIPGSLVLIHVRKRLATVVHNLVGVFQEVVDLKVYL